MDDLQKIAARFITLYDNALKAKGLHTVIGIEQEFQLEHEQGHELKDSKAAFAATENIGKAFYKESFAAKAKLGNKVRFGPLESFSREYHDGDGKTMEQFEFATRPSGPLQAAQRTEGLKRFIASHTPDNAGYNEKKATWKARKIDFPAYSDSQQCYGMHINVSLKYKAPSAGKYDQDAYLLSPHCASPMDVGKVADALTYGLRSITESDLLLVADTPKAYVRLQDPKYGADGNLARATRKKPTLSEGLLEPSQQRIEFRLPAGNADPFLATLAVMSSVHEQFGHTAAHAEVTKEGAVKLSKEFRDALADAPAKTDILSQQLCSSPAEARARFSESSKVVASMKKLAAEFGTAQDVADAERFAALVVERSIAKERLEKAATLQTGSQISR